MAPQKDGAGMSAFERRRLENIATNQALLNNAAAVAKKVAPKVTPKSTPKAKTRSTRSTPATRESTRPTRMSSRLAGLDADNETLKRKMEVETQTASDLARAKKMRVNGDLSLGDISVEGKKWEAGVGGLKGLIRGAQPGVRTFTEDDITETTDKALKGLRLRMGGLKLYEHWAPNDIKITPQRAYALGFHPTESKPIVFAGDKEGAMGVFDASQTPPEVDDEDEDAKVPGPQLSAFKSHSRTISGFAFSQYDANSVFSASYDSSIRKLDLEKETSIQVFAPSDANDEMPISALDMADAEPNLLFFSTLDGSVGRYDLRTSGEEAEIWTLSDQKIGGFSLHPLQPHFVATASLDRTLKIWDLRKITGKGDLRHPALIGEHNSRLSVSHASWSPGGHIATSSYDDTIKIYDFSDASSWKTGQDIKAMEPSHTVRHNNQTGRWVTILKPQWQKRPNDGIQKFVIGNMNRFVDVFASDGSQLAQLDGDGISAVPAVAHFHPTLDWVAGATASGKLCLWQ
ncbi:WD40-repeat-containing domain protein [Dactylonectria estremocensis]|uniref:DNA damage-binding protein CMR1 n=1 Tax=Dactylonectria estremocensis TaxID=1079267 RepID=A0A9P9E3Q8_9HYPO|nr:WD40-repeat-containing domain protein [Dactylonectria estremocensis]